MQTQVHYTEHEGISKSQFKSPVTSPAWCKPRGGGLWTSTLMNGKYKSGWQELCIRYGYRGRLDNHSAWIFTPKYHAKVFRIDSLADLDKLLENYGLNNDRWAEHMAVFDYNKLVENGIDAIWLTTKGLRDQPEYYDPQRPTLYNWDCESTLWLRWAFDSVKELKNE